MKKYGGLIWKTAIELYLLCVLIFLWMHKSEGREHGAPRTVINSLNHKLTALYRHCIRTNWIYNSSLSITNQVLLAVSRNYEIFILHISNDRNSQCYYRSLSSYDQLHLDSNNWIILEINYWTKQLANTWNTSAVLNKYFWLKTSESNFYET